MSLSNMLLMIELIKKNTLKITTQKKGNKRYKYSYFLREIYLKN